MDTDPGGAIVIVILLAALGIPLWMVLGGIALVRNRALAVASMSRRRLSPAR